MSFLWNAGSSNADYYPRALSYPLQSYRIYDYDYALMRDPLVYERLRRDAVVAFALRYRKLLSAGRDWYLEPVNATEQDRLLIKILDHLLKEMDYFDMGRFNLAEAVIAGSRWAKIEGEARTIVIDGVDNREWQVCTRLRDMDKRRFRQYAVDDPDVETQVRWSDPKNSPVPFQERRRRWIWQVYRPLQKIWQSIDRDDYVRHVYDDREDNLGYGGGLASELYTYWYAKEIALQHGLQYLERWSQGIIIAQVETLRDGKPSFPTSNQRMNDWLAAFEKMRSRHVLVADAADKIDVKDAPTGGWQAALEAIRYLDGAMRVAILGSTLPTSMDVEGGSYALAEVQQQTTETLAKFDLACLEETLRRDLLGWLFRKNYGTLSKLGLKDCTLPYFRLRDAKTDNAQERADVILKARQANMLIKKDEAYAQLGLTPPAKGDEVLPPLAMSESLNQGGDGGAPPPKPGLPGQVGKQGREIVDQKASELGARNPIRPENNKGGKNEREKAIDSISKGFATDPSYRDVAVQDLLDLFRASLARDRAPAASNVTVNVPEQPSVPFHLHTTVAAPNVSSPVTVNVPPAPEPNVTVNVPAPVVNFRAPDLTVPAPVVHVAAPNVTVRVPEAKAPVVNVQAPEVKVVNVREEAPRKSIVFQRDADGNVTGAQVGG